MWASLPAARKDRGPPARSNESVGIRDSLRVWPDSDAAGWSSKGRSQYASCGFEIEQVGDGHQSIAHKEKVLLSRLEHTPISGLIRQWPSPGARNHAIILLSLRDILSPGSKRALEFI